MSNFLNLDPSISSALIAAITSLAIAGTSGIYLVVSTRKKLEKLKQETVTEALAKASVESFNADRLQYRQAYKTFYQDALHVSEDINELFRTLFEFYRETARLFAIRHKDFILSDIAEKISSTDEALKKLFQAKTDGHVVGPEDLVNAAYRGMKSVVEGLAEQ